MMPLQRIRTGPGRRSVFSASLRDRSKYNPKRHATFTKAARKLRKK